MNTQEKIQIMQAFVEGKTIEAKDSKLTNSKFYAPLSSDREPLWNWESFDYRIKPDPMEIRVLVKDYGQGRPFVIPDQEFSMVIPGYTLKTFVEKV